MSMKFKLLDLFVEEIVAEYMDLQMIVMVKFCNKVIQFTFRGAPKLIRQWLEEVEGESLFIEVSRLYDVTTTMSYGVKYMGEIHEIERNSIALETEHFNYDEPDTYNSDKLGELLREKFGA